MDPDEVHQILSKSSKVSASKKVKKVILRKETKEVLITDLYKGLLRPSVPRSTSVRPPTRPNAHEIQEIKSHIEQCDAQKTAIEVELAAIKERTLQVRQDVDSYQQKARNLLSRELAAFYELVRFQKHIPDKRIGFKSPSGQNVQSGLKRQLLQRLQDRRMILSKGGLSSHQRVVLEREVQDLTMRLETLMAELEQHQENQRIAVQEQNCFLSSNKWQLHSKRYVPLQLIGKGGFSEVYKGYDIERQCFVAIKLSSANQLAQSLALRKDYIRRTQRQYEIHKQLDHSNIAKIYDVIEAVECGICFVLEYCDGIDLGRYLRRYGHVNEWEAKGIAKQLFSALKYMHSQAFKVVHYDIKPQNIIFHKGLVKIVDFGLCKTIQNSSAQIALTSQGAGTLAYLPPESFSLEGAMISEKVDIWSTGIVLHELITGRRPARSLDGAVILDASLSLDASLLLSRCLISDPKIRVDATQALQTEFLREECFDE